MDNHNQLMAGSAVSPSASGTPDETEIARAIGQLIISVLDESPWLEKAILKIESCDGGLWVKGMKRHFDMRFEGDLACDASKFPNGLDSDSEFHPEEYLAYLQGRLGDEDFSFAASRCESFFDLLATDPQNESVEIPIDRQKLLDCPSDDEDLMMFAVTFSGVYEKIIGEQNRNSERRESRQSKPAA